MRTGTVTVDRSNTKSSAGYFDRPHGRAIHIAGLPAQPLALSPAGADLVAQLEQHDQVGDAVYGAAFKFAPADLARAIDDPDQLTNVLSGVIGRAGGISITK